MNVLEVRPLSAMRHASPLANRDEQVEVRVMLRAGDLEKLQVFMSGDTWEKAQAAREAALDQCVESVGVLMNFARRHSGTSGGRVCATVLASLYNGERVAFDLSDLKLLDPNLYEHAMNTIRACCELNREPHDFFEDGGRHMEQLIADWGLEKKRRARR